MGDYNPFLAVMELREVAANRKAVEEGLEQQRRIIGALKSGKTHQARIIHAITEFSKRIDTTADRYRNVEGFGAF